ncbi:MAG: PQQ-dependent sugar dehydrogenase [Anaerolineales bacterium]
MLAGLALAGLVLTACGGLGAPENPTVVGSPPTLPPATETSQAAPTEEAASPTSEQAAPSPTAAPVERVTSLPDAGGYLWQEFDRSLNSPTFLTNAGDGSGRIFVLEKSGRIQVYVEGVQQEAPFLDIVSLVNSNDFERGLLGLAFHPNYAENGLFFVDYTDVDGNTVVARYQVSDDPNAADPNSAVVLLNINQPYANHNGGMLAFGPDGYLYIGMGDGGAGGDPKGNAQSMNTLLGKILRIDVDNAADGKPYGIPDGNAPGGLPEIWALGLRNPWRFSFDRVTGEMLIGDVGQGAWEEIDILPNGILGGINLGWDYYEGTHPYEGTAPDSASLIYPVIEYGHGNGNCSVSGGYTYRGAQLPDFQGVYLYGDYCSGTVWGALPGSDSTWQTSQLFQLNANISSFGEDEAGELYLVDLQGTIYKLVQK